MLGRLISAQSSRLLERTLTNPKVAPGLSHTFDEAIQLQLPTESPLALSVRHRNANVKRPNIPCSEKAAVLKLTWETYKYPLEGMTAAETCIEAVKHEVRPAVAENHPLEVIWAREMYQQIESSPVFVVLHRHRSTKEDLFNMRVQFKRNNMKYFVYNTKVTNHALTGTKYENLLKLFVARTVSAVSYDRDIGKILKLDRKLPYATVLACVMDGKILSKADMVRVSQMPPLPQMHAQMCQVLGQHQVQLRSNLTRHQSELSGALQRHSDGPPQ